MQPQQLQQQQQQLLSCNYSASAAVVVASAAVFTVVAATVVIPSTLLMVVPVVPVEKFSADCFSSMARVMNSMLARKVVLALPRLLLSSSEQVATIALANAVNIVSRVAVKGALVTWIEIAVTSVANSAQLYSWN